MNETRHCDFSEDRVYRYALRIRWSEHLPLVQFIGLNPSTADETKDDPTIRRCRNFAKAWGMGGMVMTNLFAFRATQPGDMKRAKEPIGETGKTWITTGNAEFSNRNDFFLYSTAIACPVRIAAWGTHGSFLYRAAKVKQFMPQMQCIRVTSGGFPEHPLYLPATLTPIALP